MKLEEYKRADAPLPETYQAWQVFGAGIENVGRDGKPVTVPMREPEANEVLVRVDALGLCLSDIKIIKLGNEHPRLRGRDLATDPTVLGHEAAVTIVKVGDQWKSQFTPGDRYIVQADIYYKGFNYAFGYLIPGGLAQYAFLDERALAGDEGCYLLPVKPETGYSQSALSEPWACVEMSYCLSERLMPEDGEMLIVSDDAAEWRLANPAATIVPRSLEGLDDEKFDDIVLPAPTPALVTALAPRLRKNGVMYLLGTPAESGAASVDIGRMHYEGVHIIGGAETVPDVANANERTDLLPGGAALFIGAGGPMGQMHVQRAIELANASSLVVVTDLDRARLDHIESRFAELAQRRNVALKTFAPSQFDSQDAMDAHIRSLSPQGYDDVCVLAPVPRLVQSALAFAANNAIVNVFAGMAVGTIGDVTIDHLCRGVKILGSSGSRISDLRRILSMVEAGELNTNLSVAAVGGLSSARTGLEGVRDAKYPGKVVIYPQVLDLPIMSLDEIAEKLPEVGAKLGDKNAWTKEAEAAFLEKYL